MPDDLFVTAAEWANMTPLEKFRLGHKISGIKKIVKFCEFIGCSITSYEAWKAGRRQSMRSRLDDRLKAICLRPTRPSAAWEAAPDILSDSFSIDTNMIATQDAAKEHNLQILYSTLAAIAVKMAATLTEGMMIPFIPHIEMVYGGYPAHAVIRFTHPSAPYMEPVITLNHTVESKVFRLMATTEIYWRGVRERMFVMQISDSSLTQVCIKIANNIKLKLSKTKK